MNPAIVPAITGVVGLFLGILIGHYKSQAEFQEKMNKKVDHEDCRDCDLRAVVKDITGDLKDGNAAFKEIRESLAKLETDIAVIKQVTAGRKG